MRNKNESFSCCLRPHMSVRIDVPEALCEATLRKRMRHSLMTNWQDLRSIGCHIHLPFSINFFIDLINSKLIRLRKSAHEKKKLILIILYVGGILPYRQCGRSVMKKRIKKSWASKQFERKNEKRQRKMECSREETVVHSFLVLRRLNEFSFSIRFCVSSDIR